MKPLLILTDIRMTSDPKMVTDNLATVGVVYNEKYKTRNGEPVDKAHFYQLEFWGHRAEYLMKYAHKGARISAMAFPKNDRWEKDGKKYERISFVVSDFNFADTKGRSEPAAASGNAAPDAPDFPADDTPF